uniref:Uncharacterized protein n=1 Tax=Neurospora crassa TaxID=5141 RepID=Q6M9J0_NEUCS|nr:hypothetical protein [Neurospora crassa]
MCEASHFGDADPPERTGTALGFTSYCMRELEGHCTAMTKVLERYAVSLILLDIIGSVFKPWRHFDIPSEQFVQLDALLVMPSSCIDPYEDEDELRWATKNSTHCSTRSRLPGSIKC